MDSIIRLGESIGCVPERVELSFWGDDGAIISARIPRGSVKYSIDDMGNIKALLVYSGTVDYGLLEGVLHDCPDCEHLILWISDLSILPSAVAQFSALATLDLWNTEVAELPEWMGKLTTLTSLDLSGTQVTELPEEIGNLTALTMLDLWDTQTMELPEQIGNLTALISLDISDTQIAELPESIGNLTALSELDIYGTKITELPESIGKLIVLSELDISGTPIAKLPESIGNLTALSSLSISETKITELPEGIYSLPLKKLDLSGLVLESLPKDILRLDLPFVFKQFDSGINLSDTDILEVGTSIFRQPIDEIKLFYDELEREKVPLNEARVIFIGDGGAGKSTIIHKLQTDEYRDKLPETKGVLIQKWRDEAKPQSPLISFWDFGGQAVMHSMHEFFLGERCLYVLVLDGRRDDRPEYWLDMIGQYGRKSSVMIVMNKIDQNKNAHVDPKKLRREYGDKFHEMCFHEISCKKGTGFDDFKSELLEMIHQSESCHKMFPGRWYRIKLKLEDLRDQDGKPTNYLREDIYRGYCEEEGIEERSPQDTLLRWLNDLGICFSYKSEDPMGTVDELKVLRPEWITNGVYKIINSEEAKRCNGFIQHRVMKEILETNDDVNPTYKNTETGFILGMMRDFMLSYQVDGAEFIPMLTADSEPDIPPLEDAIHLQIQYSAPLPTSVLYNFAVQMKMDVDRALTWRRGTYLKSKHENCSAIVRFGKTKDILDIYVSGNSKAAYLAHIRRNLAHVQRKMDTKFDEYIEYRVHDKVVMLRLKRLLTLFRNGISEDLAEDIEETVNVIDVLSSVVPSDVISNLLEELSQLKQDKASFEEMRNLLFSIDSKTDAILLNTRKLGYALEKIQDYSEEQREMLRSLFEEISRNNTNAALESTIHSILEEVKQGEPKAIGDSLLRFISGAGSVASLYPYVGRLLSLIMGVIS